MADLYSYKTAFEPILLPGETAHLLTSSGMFDVECIAHNALPEREYDFGALTAATWDTDNEWTGLEMNQGEFAQFRMRVLSDMQLRLNNLSPTRQWRTAKADFYLYQWPQQTGEDFLKEFIFKASEFFVYEDDTPRFDFYSTQAQVASTVLFSGWRFRIRKLPVGVIGKTTILVSGWPATNR